MFHLRMFFKISSSHETKSSYEKFLSNFYKFPDFFINPSSYDDYTKL